jgi:hypothetical protein
MFLEVRNQLINQAFDRPTHVSRAIQELFRQGPSQFIKDLN